MVLKSSLCEFSDVYIPAKGTISILNTADAVAAGRLNNRNNTINK